MYFFSSTTTILSEHGPRAVQCRLTIHPHTNCKTACKHMQLQFPCLLIQCKMCSDVVLVVQYCYSPVCHQAVQVNVCGWNMNQKRRRL